MFYLKACCLGGKREDEGDWTPVDGVKIDELIDLVQEGGKIEVELEQKELKEEKDQGTGAEGEKD